MITHLPGIAAFRFPSQGADLIGFIYLGGGEGPRPTCIFFHGFPGAEKNWDIAYALRERGWNALIWSPRGCWGSGGHYTLAGVQEDAAALIDYLRGQDWPIAWERLALLGYSLGGAQAIQFAQARPGLARALALLAPVGDFRELSLSDDFALQSSPFLAGTTPAGLQKAWMSQAWGSNPVDLLPELALPMLLVQGEADEVTPAYLAQDLAAANPHCELVMLAAADHAFSARRGQLVQTTTAWLGEHLGA